MHAFDRSVSVGVAVCVALLAVVWVSHEGRLRAQGNAPPSLVGAWTLNKDLSDKPPERPSDTGDTPDRTRRRSGGGFGRGGGGFGRGGGGYGRGGGGSTGTFDPAEVARMREAMHDLMNPPDHLTIVQAGTLIVITGPDGRTTRLSPDGKKIKDESTKIERSTKWDGPKLVSEIKGLGAGKITETYSVDAEHHQLHVALQIENTRRPMATNHVYDADAGDR